MANQRVHKILPRTLRSAWPSDQLEDSQSPACLNVRFRFGVVKNAPGRGFISNPPLNQVARNFGRYNATSGVTWILLLMDNAIFKWGTTAPATPRSFLPIFNNGATQMSAAPRKWSTLTAEDKFFFTNGGEIFRWPDTAFSGGDPVLGRYESLNEVATGGVPPSAKFLEYLNNHLIAGYVTDGVTTKPYRIRWTVGSNHLDWAGTGSGFLDLLEESQEPIMGMKGLGDRLVVYKEHAIYDVISTGTLTPIFVSQVRVRGLGTRYPYTIDSNGVNHFFLGVDSRVYMWNGIEPIAISEDIDQELAALVDDTSAESYYGVCVVSRGEYWLILNPSEAFVYNYIDGTWARDSFSSIFTMAEIEDSQVSPTWAQLIGSWSTQATTWDQLQGSQFTTLWAGRDDGSVYRIDDIYIDDYYSAGGVIDKNVETPDFYVAGDPMEQAVLQRVMLLYEFVNDRPFEFSYSVDRGKTWKAFDITPVQLGYSVVDINATSNVFRFKLRANNAGGLYNWKSYVYEWLPGGPYLPAPV